jgi:hypothetical protein
MKPKKSRKKYIYDYLSSVEVYQLILAGKIKRFPAGTWNQPDSVEYAAEIVQYWIEHILEWSDEDIKKGLSAKLFNKHKLDGLLTVFKDSPFYAIEAAYPGRFKEWELQKVPLGFWTKENGIKAVKWLIEEKLNWSPEEIERNLSKETFLQFGLSGMLHYCFGNSPFQAINTAYPGQFKEWDLSIAPQKYWSYENAIAAFKWLIEKKLQWNDEDIKKNLSMYVFTKNRLASPFHKFFNGSPFQALDAIYPGRFKEWELPVAPMRFWTNENPIKAVKWLIEEKLQWSDEDIKQQLSGKTFIDNGLHGLLHNAFNNSPFKALDSTYPGRFKEWELSRVPKNYWTKENAIKAIKWLIEEKLKWPDEEIKRKMSGLVFEKHGLSRLLAKFFNFDAFEALNAAYPGRFTRQDLLRLRKPKIAYRAFPEVSPKI